MHHDRSRPPGAAHSPQLGQLLRAARKRRGLTQAEVGARLGLSQNRVSGWGSTKPMAAPDGHAKKFSLHLLPGGRYRLTPLYDVTSAYPVMGDGPNPWSPRGLKPAMALVGKNRHYEAEPIQRRHVNSTARRFGYRKTAEPLLQEIIARTPSVIDEVQRGLPRGFSQSVADNVLDGLQRAARALEGMPAT